MIDFSPDLQFKPDLVTQKVAVIGRSGSGKTYAAGKLIEGLLEQKAQVVVVDPVGIHYALRLAADGKGPGFEIPVFGGARGDVPLEATGGSLVADLVVDRGVSLVLDVSDFTGADQRRFVTDFATRLLHRKKQKRSAVMLVWEECQEFVPQHVRGDVAKMVGAMERLIKLGRNYGIGTTLISQRPQAVNKDVLNQTEVLIVLQTTGPQERKAIQGWVGEHGVEKDAAIDELPRLPVGTAFVWSPQWMRIFKRVHVGKKRTFDASSTPTFGARAAKVRELAPVDLDAIRESMVATIERAKAEDPRELRKALATERRAREAAEGFLESLKRQAEARPEKEKRVEVPVVRPAEVKRLEALAGRFERQAAALGDVARGIRTELARIGLRACGGCAAGAPVGEDGWHKHPNGRSWMHCQNAGRTVAVAPATQSAPAPAPRAQASRGTARGALPRRAPLPAAAPPRRASGGGAATEGLTGPEQRILDALAWLESIGVSEPEQAAAAFLAGYTIGGGAWNNPKGRLRGRQLLTYLPGDRLALTEEGRALARQPDAPLTQDELHRRVLGRLPGPERKLLTVLLLHHPEAVPMEQLAKEAGYEVGGGAFNNPRGRLRTLGLATYPDRGLVRAADLLFLEA